MEFAQCWFCGTTSFRARFEMKIFMFCKVQLDPIKSLYLLSPINDPSPPLSYYSPPPSSLLPPPSSSRPLSSPVIIPLLSSYRNIRVQLRREVGPFVAERTRFALQAHTTGGAQVRAPSVFIQAHRTRFRLNSSQ